MVFANVCNPCKSIGTLSLYGIFVTRQQHKMSVLHQKYEEAVKKLNQLQNQSMKFGKHNKMALVNMNEFLERVDVSDQDLNKMKIIHVSGTKGKGSTCAFVESILRHSGFSTGFFSSPHLIEVRERIRFNGKPISSEVFASYFWKVYALLDSSKNNYSMLMPSYFYFLTTMAFYIFKHEPVDVVIMEVGIGGAYDCTNVIRQPAVCGVTSLGIDHVNILGSTIESIAWQKAGIFKNMVPAFTVEQPQEALAVLKKRAKDIGTDLHVVPDLTGYWKSSRKNIDLGLPGDYQQINASLAVQLAYCWINHKTLGSPIALNNCFVKGLECCKWHGRAEVLKFNNISFFLDGAHTKQSISYAAAWFDAQAAKEQIELGKPCSKILAFCVTGDRNASDLLSVLFHCKFSSSVFTPCVSTLCSSTFNDQTDSKHSVEDQLLTAVQIRDDWANVCSSLSDTSYHTNAFVFPSIADAVCCLVKDKNEDLFKQVHSLTTNSLNANIRSIFPDNHLQVLVTGSLRLVGAYLRVLKPDLNFD